MTSHDDPVSGRPLGGKVALVTGAGRGIGRATALRLARDGARVVVHHGASAEAADGVVHAIRQAGGDAVALQADLSDEQAPAELWRRASHWSGQGIDILVNNAGILGAPADITDLDLAEHHRVMAVNTTAPLLLARCAAREMLDGGRIINVSTKFTHGGAKPPLLSYTMSKAAIDTMTSTLARALGPRGITVNAVGPGAVDTDLNATRFADPAQREAAAGLPSLRRIAQPEDVADIIAFLAGPDARWVTGQWIDATGGELV